MWYLLDSEKNIIVYGTYLECFAEKDKGVLIVHEDELWSALY